MMTYLTVLQACPYCGGGSGVGGWGMGGSGMWGYGFLGPLLWLLIIAVIVLGAVYLFTNRTDNGDSDRAVDLLREQYARGEITDEEFENRSSRLSAGTDRSSSATR